MNRIELLEHLEGRYIPIEIYSNRNGELFTSLEWKQVEYESVRGQFGIINLALYSEEGLRGLVRESLSQGEYQAMVMNQQKEYQAVAG